MSQSENPLTHFIGQIYARKHGTLDGFNETTELIDSQILDSVNLVELLLFIQDTLDTPVSFGDLNKDNFKTILVIEETMKRIRKTDG